MFGIRDRGWRRCRCGLQGVESEFGGTADVGAGFGWGDADKCVER